MKTKIGFWIAAVSALLACQGIGQDWKLNELKYNNPGLDVDLGVGLWAWPMPMDYDGDGDMDLLVACPDKPSNGVYYFENPTQDPKNKMPVFKAGVHLGKTGHNMQVSYVDGEPRILRSNGEYLNFKEEGFKKVTKVYPSTNFHKGKTRAHMWRYVDWEGDGDQDLVVGIGDWTDYVWDQAYDAEGRWRNGPLHGFVYLIENVDGKYTDNPVKITAAGSEIDVYGWPSPNFSDFDGDGDLDLLCGEFLDGFTYFQNIGTRSKPDYATGLKLKGSDGNPLVMDLQMITPTAFDWDGDGDFDLITGDEDGRVALVENVSETGGELTFHQPVYFQQEADTLKYGALATPFAHDWDGDGDEDILCGNTAGYVGFFENLGSGDSGLPKWAAPKNLQVNGKDFRILAGPNGSIQGPAEAKWGYTTLSVADWNADGSDDVVVNSIWPKLTLLEKTGKNELITMKHKPLDFWSEEAPPKFYWWQTKAESLQTQWRTTPMATDFDQDGKMDLVILDQEGYLSLQSRKLKEGDKGRIFVDEDNQPWRFNKQTAGRSGRVKLVVADWDGDGRDDVIVNSENATWYRNCEERDGKVVLKKIGNLAKRNVAGHTSSPSVCDFDKDGKLDLLVGSENGRIYHIAHDDCVQFSAEDLKAREAKAPAKPRFPGFVSEEFIYSKASFPQCHASTLCETPRGLVAAWFGGTKEKDPDVGIWSSYNDGAGWTAPKEWANGVQYEGKRHPTWNPVLFQPPGDGPTMLFFKVGPNPAEWWGEMMLSYDSGRSFRDRRRLPEGIDGPVRCKPVMLDGGTLLAGSSTEYDGWTLHFEMTDDLGQSWRRVGPINDASKFNAIQPTILQHKGGKLQVLCRTKESVIVSSFSEDQGKTWSKLKALDMPNPNSGIEVVTLNDGRFLMIYNHLGSGKTGWGRRGMLNLAMSEDGIQWKAVAILEKEEKGEFSYPAIIQTKDGLVHMTYTWKRQKVKHMVVDPGKLTVGKLLSKENWPED